MKRSKLPWVVARLAAARVEVVEDKERGQRGGDDGRGVVDSSSTDASTEGLGFARSRLVLEVEGTCDDRETMERRGDRMLMNCIVVADGRSHAVIPLRFGRASDTPDSRYFVVKVPGAAPSGDQNQFSIRQR